MWKLVSVLQDKVKRADMKGNSEIQHLPFLLLVNGLDRLDFKFSFSHKTCIAT
jgi:hypothetical protein